jgi:DNA polymerase III alpha subunit
MNFALSAPQGGAGGPSLRLLLEPLPAKTLAVPLFQEQAMQISVLAADFTAGEADQLGRAPGSFRGPDSVEAFRERFITGCQRKGNDQAYAEPCFLQL